VKVHLCDATPLAPLRYPITALARGKSQPSEMKQFHTGTVPPHFLRKWISSLAVVSWCIFLNRVSGSSPDPLVCSQGCVLDGRFWPPVTFLTNGISLIRQHTLLVRVWISLLSTSKPVDQFQQNLNERCATGSHPTAFTLQSVSRQVHSLFQNKFSSECVLFPVPCLSLSLPSKCLRLEPSFITNWCT